MFSDMCNWIETVSNPALNLTLKYGLQYSTYNFRVKKWHLLLRNWKYVFFRVLVDCMTNKHKDKYKE